MVIRESAVFEAALHLQDAAVLRDGADQAIGKSVHDFGLDLDGHLYIGTD